MFILERRFFSPDGHYNDPPYLGAANLFQNHGNFVYQGSNPYGYGSSGYGTHIIGTGPCDYVGYHQQFDQKHALNVFDEMSTDEEDGINSSNSKENSVQLIEQATDSEFIASVAINFIDCVSAELLPKVARLTKVEQNSDGAGLSIGNLKASLKRNISEVVEPVKEEMLPTYEQQSEVKCSVPDYNLDLQRFVTDHLSSHEVFEPGTFNLDVMVANYKDTCIMNLNLEVGLGKWSLLKWK